MLSEEQQRAAREDAGQTPEPFWDDFHRQRDRPWSGNPNAFLVEAVARRRPGTALEIGCADGGDVNWLAGQGWRVTGVDISPVALRRAAERADALGVGDRVTFERHDLAHTFPEGRFDIVGSFYTQSPIDFPRARVLQRAAQAVAPGGLLLIVEHGSAAPWSWNPHHHFPSVVETLTSLNLDFAVWEVERLAAPWREATGPNGEIATITDNVIAARRVR